MLSRVATALGILMAAAMGGGMLPVAAQSFSEGAASCCQSKAIIVPVVTYVIDIGLPVLLLVACYFILRARRAKVQLEQQNCNTAVLERRSLLLNQNPPFQALSVVTPAGDADNNSPPQHITAALSQVLSWGAGIMFILGGKKKTSPPDNDAERLLSEYASLPHQELYTRFKTSESGLTKASAEAHLKQWGPNRLTTNKPTSCLRLIASAVVQPFNFLMATVAIVTLVPPNNDKRTFTLILVLLMGAIVLRFIEEVKSLRTSEVLQSDITAVTHVLRDGVAVKVTLLEIAPGDVVLLSRNDLVPADVRVLEASNLHIGMSSLTGETLPVQKTAAANSAKVMPLEHSSLALMGTHVVSGTGKCLVLATGDKTYIASMSRMLSSERALNAFDYAIRRIVYVFIIFIVIMVPIVIVLNGTSTGSWSGAVAFGLSVAVGLSPQMMPMIITANLARGANLMRKQNTVIRRLDAVQNLGGMDILCTDKTGTLTKDEVTLEDYVDTRGEACQECLKLAYANAQFQAGVVNQMDLSILKVAEPTPISVAAKEAWVKLDEIPYDFERRMVSVIVSSATDSTANPLLICKGAVEEVLLHCTDFLDEDAIVAVDSDSRAMLLARCECMYNEGYRLLGLATKEIVKTCSGFDKEVERGMLFRGFLVFMDPPKTEAKATVELLTSQGIEIKVLTGDNLLVAKRLCKELDIPVSDCLTGSQIAAAEADSLPSLVKQASVFAKVSPQQKLLIVTLLQQQDHIVGFLGDGTNDALALRKADVGISVDSGTDVAKDAADVVMLDKELGVLATGIKLGRVTYGNTIKYIKFASSSSFGNTFSFLAAAAWLPFNPLAPIQVLALNLLYNISQMAIPWDTMDEAFLKKPKRWRAKFLGLYMLIVGPTSSIFDMTTFLIMWYFFKNNNSSTDSTIHFQTAWFLESLMTQTFIVHLLRTERIPFVQSRASWPLMVSSFGTMVAGTVLCYIPQLNQTLSLSPTYPLYYAFLAATVFAYCFTVQVFKVFYIWVFHCWL